MPSDSRKLSSLSPESNSSVSHEVSALVAKAVSAVLCRHPFASSERQALLLGASTPGLFSAIREQALRGGIELDVELFEEMQELAVASTVTRREKQEVTCRRHTRAPTDLRIRSETFEKHLSNAAEGNYASLVTALAASRSEAPLISDDSVDVVVVDMMANRLDSGAWHACLAESFRVLRKEGLVVVTAYCADERVAPGRRHGPWSALEYPQEKSLLDKLAEAGFHGVTFENKALGTCWGVEDAAIRPFVVTGYKGKHGVCLDQGDAVIYRGPMSSITDDDGHTYLRGERTAVCAKTFALLSREPYRSFFIPVPCQLPPPLHEAPLFDCSVDGVRAPRETKFGLDRVRR